MGIGFAIPVNMVKGVVATAQSRRQGGQAAVARRLAAGRHQGDRRFDRARPAGRRAGRRGDRRRRRRRKPGLKRGDVITAIDGQPVDDSGGVGFRLGEKPLGGVAALTCPAQRQDHRPVAEARRGAGNSAARRDPHQQPLAVQGAMVMNISPALIEEMSIEGRAQGGHRHRRRARLDRRRRRPAERRPRPVGQRRKDRHHPRPRKSRRLAPPLLETGDRARGRGDPVGVRGVGEKSQRLRRCLRAGTGG